ncbi:uncharacterized protein [Battus philenor]|uniref:uncharacterized protein n=1 Tax=Battus philenor TaxID=42288 RepID=UPI0035D060A3
MLFCEKLDLRLLALVRASPVLYDHGNPRYMDLNAREVAWQRIGDELRRPAADCKVRWINIRDVYRRILRKSLNDSEPRTKMYKYENELAFMRPFYKDVIMPNSGFDSDSKSNDRVNEDSNDPDHSEEDSKPIRKIKKRSSKLGSKKRKKKIYEERKDEMNLNNETLNEPTKSELDVTDPVDAFLMSIGATLKTFSPYHLNLAKTKIFSVVQDHELQQIIHKQRQNSSNDSISNDKYGDYLH